MRNLGVRQAFGSNYRLTRCIEGILLCSRASHAGRKRLIAGSMCVWYAKAVLLRITVSMSKLLEDAAMSFVVLPITPGKCLVRNKGSTAVYVFGEGRLLKLNTLKNLQVQGFPGGAVVRSPPANAGDTGSSPGPGRSHMPRSS